MNISNMHRSALAAVAVGFVALTATNASAAPAKIFSDLGTCATTDLTDSSSCDGMFVNLGSGGANDSETVVNGLNIFGYNNWDEIAKVENASGTDGILRTTVNDDDKSGDWFADLSAYATGFEIMAVLKASTGFAAYLLSDALVGDANASGTWSTAALSTASDNQPGLSHFTLYAYACTDNDPTCGGGGVTPPDPSPVPLPAGMPLLLGALGVMAIVRRKTAKSAA